MLKSRNISKLRFKLNYSFFRECGSVVGDDMRQVCNEVTANKFTADPLLIRNLARVIVGVAL